MLNQREKKEFCALRRQAIERDYMHLNPRQRQAVMTADGPLLLLAGAGSGKTTVLINRIACLMKYGRGARGEEVPDWVGPEDLGFLGEYIETQNPDPEMKARQELLCSWQAAAPWSIIAITFTNKAAGELKDRLERMLGADAQDVWAYTFHSTCLRILRRNMERLGMSSQFSIYDTDDSVRVIKDILKEFNLDDKAFPPKTVLRYISQAKDAMKMGPEFLQECENDGDFRMIKIAKIYVEYQRRLWDASALDFDDIIFHTVRLLQEDEEVRAYYQNKFRYVLIDEYQDTNHLQYLLASLLAGKWENICVVGDDDQSIYRFRGATIENILSFENQYKGAQVIRLEQNYRSTGNILAACNEVIRHNQGRKGKELWTEQGDGEKVTLYSAMNESDEARYVAASILKNYGQGRSWKEHAVLYRMNAQSNQLEYACKRNGIPYRIIGGTRFFDRTEVKDMLAYLCVIHNPGDDLRLRRIINTPARGIGAKTLETAREIAIREEKALYHVVEHAADYPQLGGTAPRLMAFARMIRELQGKSFEMDLDAFYQEVLSVTGYVTALQAKDSVENRSRIENVEELGSSIRGYLENAGDEPTLAGFLDEVALYTDLDSQQAGEDCVVMMTMHSAKGLEFPYVYVVGMEEGIFPGTRSIGDPEAMEEERRLCYVAMTRAKEKLTLSCAAQRMIFGHTSNNRPSRFVGEIPPELLEKCGSGHQQQRRMYRFDADPNDEPEHYQRPRYEQRGGSSYGAGGRPRVSRSSGWKGTRSIGSAGISWSTAPIANFRKGDMVEHAAFGTGMVLNLMPMGGDALVEIAFDTVGTKKLMLKTAAQYMKKKE